MLIRRVELADFRSYERLSLDLDREITTFVGSNGHGKTNLIEAICRIAVGTSHRVANDQVLVRQGADRAVIRLVVDTDTDRRRQLELEVGPTVRTRTRVDGQDVRRAADAQGILRIVMFAPEDLALVRGDPAERRRYLDEVLGQRRPAYAVARADFERVLRQRNQLLKQMRSLNGTAREAASETLATWTEQLIHHATQITAARIAAVAAIAAPVEQHYRGLAARGEVVGVRYVRASRSVLVDGPIVEDHEPDPSNASEDVESGQRAARIATELRNALEVVRPKEIDRGLTLVGPHRDDLELTIDDLPARTHASQGEAWSLALALRLGTYDLLADVGDRPVLLLDDVFAELDEHRRERLAQVCDDYDQVLITAAVAADVPVGGRRVHVRREGNLTQITEGDR